MNELLFDSDTPMADRLRACWDWVASGACQIRDTEARLVTLCPRPIQRRIFNAMLYQAERGRPIRIVILKARKEGVSTWVQGILYYLTQHTRHWSSATIAHTAQSTQDIFEISARMSRYGNEGLPGEIGQHAIEWKDQDSRLKIGTAGGDYVFTAGTHNAMHCSEVSKWPGTKAKVKAQLASIFGAVPLNPFSIVVLESTMNQIDESEQFEAHWLAAKSPNSPFIPIFSPWFEDPTYELPGEVVADKTPYELKLVERFNLTDARLAWRRAKIAGEFAGDARYFMQEYPATEEEAFQSPEGLIYPMLNEMTHAWGPDLDELQAGGYQFYVAIDFGATDAYVALLIAHKPGPPNFTVHKGCCPNSWRELTRYHWKDNGRPADTDDHACDASRYVVDYFDLTGHVHLAREIYEPNSAAHGKSILDLAVQTKKEYQALRIAGVVADRSQPGSILLLCQQGLFAEPYHPSSNDPSVGEKISGIRRMQALIYATVPFRHPPPPEPWHVTVMRMAREAPLRAGTTDPFETTIALSKYAESEESDPLFGGCT